MQKIHNLDDLIYSSCIYFLYNAKKIIYIGETKNLMSRIGTHSKTKVFDEVSYFICNGSDKQRKSIEASLIRKYKPCLNILCKKKPLKIKSKI
jgi:excinuclease UvrABC nuclease subunit